MDEDTWECCSSMNLLLIDLIKIRSTLKNVGLLQYLLNLDPKNLQLTFLKRGNKTEPLQEDYLLHVMLERLLNFILEVRSPPDCKSWVKCIANIKILKVTLDRYLSNGYCIIRLYNQYYTKLLI